MDKGTKVAVLYYPRDPRVCISCDIKKAKKSTDVRRRPGREIFDQEGGELVQLVENLLLRHPVPKVKMCP